MIRRLKTLLLAGALALPLAAADWRGDVAGFFVGEKGPDYAGAHAYLEKLFQSLAEEERPVASGMLAFLDARLKNRSSEYRWLGDYFERYGAIDMGFQFLPPTTRAEVYRYLRDWQLRYPWVMKMGIVSPKGATSESSLNPPDRIILGIEMANEVLYKLSLEGAVIKGGMFRRGFNEVVIDTRRFFRTSGDYPCILEFKTGDLLIRRSIVLAVRRDTYGAVGKAPAGAQNLEYAVKVFLGNRLLAVNQRTVPVTPPVNIPIPSPGGRYDPFGPGYQNGPKYPSAVPITALPAAIKEVVDAFKKRSDNIPVPPVELNVDMQYIFTERDPEAPEVEVRAHLWLDFKEIRFLSYQAQK